MSYLIKRKNGTSYTTNYISEEMLEQNNKREIIIESSEKMLYLSRNGIWKETAELLVQLATNPGFSGIRALK